MKRIYMVILVLVVCMAAGLTAHISVQASPTPQQQGSCSPPSPFPVTYDSQSTPGQSSQQLYQNLAAILSTNSTIPADRWNYYSAVNNANDCTITGFQGIITGAQQNQNGYQVTVYVNATLTSNTYGAAAFIMNSDYSEIYQVNNDSSFSYLGFTDPRNLAGLMPAIATL